MAAPDRRAGSGRDPATGSRHLANTIGVVALDITTRITVAVEAATGLTSVEVTALSALANYAEGGSVESLRSAVDLSQSATVRLIQRLVERALVERRYADGDRRVTAVHLSARGRRTVETIRRVRNDVLGRWVSRLTPAQRIALEPLIAEWASLDIAPGPAGEALANYRCRLCDPVACSHPVDCPVTAAAMTRHP